MSGSFKCIDNIKQDDIIFVFFRKYKVRRVEHERKRLWIDDTTYLNIDWLKNLHFGSQASIRIIKFKK